MRVDIHDPRTHPVHHWLDIYLDGIKVEDCESADEEAGEVTLRTIRDHAIVISTVKGHVEIKLRANTPDSLRHLYWHLRGETK